MSTVYTDKKAGETDVAYLVMSAPDDFVHDRFARELIRAGAQLQRYGAGLKMSCRGVDWKAILQGASASLSITERHDIRVATIPPGKGSAALASAIFGARRLDERLDQFSSEWVKDIINRNAVAIHFQPLIQHPPGRLHGYEYFMRGMDDAGGFIPPAKMFAAAGHLGLFPRLDEMCRLAAIARAAESGITGQLFLNFYPAAIYNPQSCLRNTVAAIEAAGFKPEQVTFEAPASHADVDRNHLAGILSHCRALGFKVALKHVGAEHASLAALTDPRPDYLKFDGGLVRRAAQSEAGGSSRSSDARAIREMTEAARQRGIMTIAGGIETEQEIKFAFDAGIRITQGYYHAKPAGAAVTPEAAKEILRRVKEVYANGKGKTAGESSKPWDISGLYQKLTTLAHAPPRKSA
ncbi:MAG TPA: EAL domain-containing protein [Tepidisphaeraceae bacterium]|jgi:EAL domain-containing protein (putative c-di-GMP-specific phosphodiesterase class I)|nr:EAL domain-containing protein [Tepidisphaeraceae bacterium]